MPRTPNANARRNKWGSLDEIDYRTKVGTPAWEDAHPRWQIRKLSAWRRMHMLGTHDQVMDWAGAQGSSRPVRDMVRAVKRAENRSSNGKAR